MRRFPDTTFVLCNAGYDYATSELKWLDSCLTLMEAYPNVQLSLNGIGSGPEFVNNAGHTTKTLATLFDVLKRRDLLSKTLYGESALPWSRNTTRAHAWGDGCKHRERVRRARQARAPRRVSPLLRQRHGARAVSFCVATTARSEQHVHTVFGNVRRRRQHAG